MLQKVNFCGTEFSRLIVGGNTISGTSHVNRAKDAEMEDYFTMGNIKKMLFRCMEVGINTMQLRGDKHIFRLIREFRQEGGRMNWIAQTAPEMRSFEGNVSQIASYKPAAIYLHGNVTDALFNDGELDELKRRLKVIRDTGYPVGLCTHMPKVLEYAGAESLDVDFFMCCVYNFGDRARIKAVAEAGNEEPYFLDSDIPAMYTAVRKLNKPALVFKILAASRRCKTQEDVRAAFDEAYANIKPGDCAIVGMYPKDLDQMALNSRYAEEAIRKATAR